MIKLEIDAQERTPNVILDKEKGILEIRGYSYPDEALEFYSEIVAWFKDYAVDPNTQTKMVFDLVYVNSTSIKFINEILKTLDQIAVSGKTVSVDWFYQPEDDDMQQLGQVLKDFHKLTITLIEKKLPA